MTDTSTSTDDEPTYELVRAPDDTTALTAKPEHAGFLGFPAMLPVELAMRTDTPENICAAYNIDYDTFVALTKNPTFVKAYEIAVEELQKDGASFKLKSRLQAEEMLKTSWALVHNPATPAAVRADLIKATVRWANLEPGKGEGGVGGGGNNFQININLGDTR